MSLFNVFDIASSAMSAQSQRLNVVASNLQMRIVLPAQQVDLSWTSSGFQHVAGGC